MHHYDLIIRNGTVLTFEPEPLFSKSDIGILEGKIAFLGSLPPESQIRETEIDASGLVVSPGFIDFHSHVDCNFLTARQLVLQGATTTIGGKRNFDGKLINKISEEGFLLNHGFFLSQSFTLRHAIGLSNPYAPATNREIQKMIRLAELFFESGSFGLHFGLEMVPGVSRKELLELSSLAKSYHKTVLIHLRKDGIEVIDALKEALEIARTSGASIHILHLMYMAGTLDLMRQCLSLLSEAISGGLNITADTGLYEAFPTYIGSSILDPGWEKHYGQMITYRDVLISSGFYNGNFCSPSSFHFLREEFPNTLVTVFAFDEKAAEIALTRPWVYVSTNAGDGPVYEGIGHPETAGTFPKLIRKYVRQKKLLSLGEAIYKITLGPASRFGISNKGNLKPGNDADLVIFDVQNLRDTSRFSNMGRPDGPPEGIKNVLVNGKIVVQDGKLTGQVHAGKLLSARQSPR